MDGLAADLYTYITSLQNATTDTGKEAIQSVLAERKIENLIERRPIHSRIEAQAVALMRRVDYSNIKPQVAWADKRTLPLWRYCRDVLSSAPFDGRPGRCMFGFVVDAISRGILGIFEIGSDLSVLGPRDRHIGWSHSQRFAKGMLRHVFNLGTCVPVQPFGWLCGGKFIASAMTAREVGTIWRRRYGDWLVAGVTTSLYGRSSQYERLREWAYLGTTNGSIGIAHISREYRRKMQIFLDDSEPNVYGRSSKALGGPGGGLVSTLNSFLHTCDRLGLDPQQYSAQQPRGVYLAELGKAALPFLRQETDDPELIQEPLESKADYWLDRWYTMRWPKKRAEIESFDYGQYTLYGRLKSAEKSAAVGELES